MPTLSMMLNERDYAQVTRAARERHQSVELLLRDAVDLFLQSSESKEAGKTDELPQEVAERWAKLRDEARAWQAFAESDRMQYDADFVAVHNGKVLDHDVDRQTLRDRIHSRFGDIVVLITPAQSSAPRIFTVRGPRLERLA